MSLAGVTAPVNFIRDDRKTSSGRARSRHIYLSWRPHTLPVFHRCAARVFYDLSFYHGEQFRAHLILLVILMLNCQASRGSVFAIGQRFDKKVCSS